MKKILIALLLTTQVVYAQNMEVTGQMKVKQMPTDNEAQELVVKKTDGTLAKRTLASLTSGTNAVDSVKSFHRDMELLQTLCLCSSASGSPTVSRFMIERLEAHGYTRQDMLKAGISEYDLDTYQTVYDIDGNAYTPVLEGIGPRIILKEPLRTTKYLDGTPILYAPTNTDWLNAGNSSTGAYCYANGSSGNADYGLLYNNYVLSAANLNKGICPAGYRAYANTDSYVPVGGKDNGNNYWDAPNFSSNSSYHSARGAGTRYPDGTYADFRKKVYEMNASTSMANATFTVAVNGFNGTFPSSLRYTYTNTLTDGTFISSYPWAAGGTIRCIKIK